MYRSFVISVLSLGLSHHGKEGENILKYYKHEIFVYNINVFRYVLTTYNSQIVSRTAYYTQVVYNGPKVRVTWKVPVYSLQFSILSIVYDYPLSVSEEV